MSPHFLSPFVDRGMAILCPFPCYTCGTRKLPVVSSSSPPVLPSSECTSTQSGAKFNGVTASAVSAATKHLSSRASRAVWRDVIADNDRHIKFMEIDLYSRSSTNGEAKSETLHIPGYRKAELLALRDLDRGEGELYKNLYEKEPRHHEETQISFNTWRARHQQLSADYRKLSADCEALLSHKAVTNSGGLGKKKGNPTRVRFAEDATMSGTVELKDKKEVIVDEKAGRPAKVDEQIVQDNKADEKNGAEAVKVDEKDQSPAKRNGEGSTWCTIA